MELLGKYCGMLVPWMPRFIFRDSFNAGATSWILLILQAITIYIKHDFISQLTVSIPLQRFLTLRIVFGWFWKCYSRFFSRFTSSFCHLCTSLFLILYL